MSRTIRIWVTCIELSMATGLPAKERSGKAEKIKAAKVQRELRELKEEKEKDRQEFELNWKKDDDGLFLEPPPPPAKRKELLQRLRDGCPARAAVLGA